MSSSSSLPQLALVGVPNVGKSSLVNRLLGTRQAIVHEVAHTTRDTAMHVCKLGDRKFMLRDTPGYAPKGEMLHESAMKQLDRALLEADVVAMVVDASSVISPDERALAVRLHKAGKPLLLVINQVDKGDVNPDSYQSLGITLSVEVSAHHNVGIAELGALLDNLLPQKGSTQAPNATTALAIIGRPNVGKSSLLNRLIGDDLAIVSEEAGTTRDPLAGESTFEGQRWRFVDTAGVRRPGKIERGVEKFSLIRTEAAIQAADICLLILDIGELAAGQDQRLAGLIEEAGRGLILVINKADTVELSEGELKRVDRVLRSNFEFISWAPYVIVSAETGLHIDILQHQIKTVANRLNTKISTHELNTALQALMAKQPPTTGTIVRPRLNYMVQVSTQPVTFRIFGTHPEKIHFSYKRYIENTMRKRYDFAGIPLKIMFESKYKLAAEGEGKDHEKPHRRTRQSR